MPTVKRDAFLCGLQQLTSRVRLLWVRVGRMQWLQNNFLGLGSLSVFLNSSSSFFNLAGSTFLVQLLDSEIF